MDKGEQRNNDVRRNRSCKILVGIALAVSQRVASVPVEYVSTDRIV